MSSTSSTSDPGAQMPDSTPNRPVILAPPPVLFFACLGAGCLLDWLWPIGSLGLGWAARAAVGGGLFLISFGVALLSFRVLMKNKTPIDPYKPATNIVREGPFRFSRNPLYGALLILLAALAALLNSFWLLLLLPVLIAMLDLGVVRPEERCLVEKFGDEYTDYMADVRRWL